MRKNKKHTINFEQEKLLLENHLKKLYKKQTELDEIYKNLNKHGASTNPIRPQINQNKQQIKLALDKINEIQDGLISKRKRELNQVLSNPKKIKRSE